MPIIKYVKGDITKSEECYIAHGVNCCNVMGSGVAKAISDKWPEVKERYHEFTSAHYADAKKYGEVEAVKRRLLGKVDQVIVDDWGTLMVYNCYTQTDYGYKKGNRYCNYDAVAECFIWLNRVLQGNQLAIPKIGSGLANGNWKIIERIINDATPDIKVVVYEL